MKTILTNGEMRRADEATIAGGVSSEILMHRAGQAIAEEIEKCAAERRARDILFVCGTGNNGGDGYVAAGILKGRGYNVAVYAAEGRLSADCQREKKRYDGRYSQHICGDIIVDCIFGTGLCREVTGEYAELIDAVNSSGAFVVAADIPSGINGDNGLIMGRAVRADLTVAVAYPKLGHRLADGIDCCGRLVVRDIGIAEVGHSACVAEDDDIRAFFPPRKRNSHKGTYGHCQAVGGRAYQGALALSLASALTGGCGYVSAVVDERLKYALVGQYPQVIYSAKTDLSADCIVFGMGMGCDDSTYSDLTRLLLDYDGKLIIDADGINALAKYGADALRSANCQVLLTPHIKEFSRILGRTVGQVLADPVGEAAAFAREYNVTVHLKSAVTLTTDGNRTVMVDRGSSALARAGSGDMLSGLIASGAARGLTPFDAAVCGQYILGRAAEITSEEVGDYCATSQDIIKNIKTVVKNLTCGVGKC